MPTQNFKPYPLGFNGHLQTILGIYLPSKWKPAYTVRRLVRVGTRDALVIHDNCPDNWKMRDRVVVMVHGLGGNHSSGYMKRISAKLNAMGIRTMRVDLRGFGSSMFTCRGHAHAGQSEDLDAVLEDIARCCPKSPISLVGFSFGGNIALKLLAEYGANPPVGLDSSVVVAPPADLTRCAENLRNGLARLYDHYFVGKLHRMMWERRRRVPGLIDMPNKKMPSRLFDFDNQFTAPLSGFRDAHDYYTKCSTIGILDQIGVKTLLLIAKDDPLIPSDMFTGISLSPSVTLSEHDSGGHLGFVSRKNEKPDRRWMDWKILQAIEQIEADQSK